MLKAFTHVMPRLTGAEDVGKAAEQDRKGCKEVRKDNSQAGIYGKKLPHDHGEPVFSGSSLNRRSSKHVDVADGEKFESKAEAKLALRLADIFERVFSKMKTRVRPSPMSAE